MLSSRRSLVARLARVVLACAVPVVVFANGPTIRVEVLGLFEPTVLEVAGSPLAVRSDGVRSTCQLLSVSYIDGAARWDCDGAAWLSAEATVVSADPVLLRVPGRIERRYPGEVTISAGAGRLHAVVRYSVESAVAAVVAAEMPHRAPQAALEAQAIAARSYYLASRRRHPDGRFCDTTHCQFLRETPDAESPAARAAAGTRGVVLRWEGGIVDALYARQCGGATREVRGGDGFVFRGVACAACRAAPGHWERVLAVEEAASARRVTTEAERIALVRRLGWNSLPSIPSHAESKTTTIVIQGKGHGHGLGLCQRGAIGMALSGATADEVLRHYYPEARVGAL